MDEVIPECIKIHNDKLLNDNERTKIIGLIELIQAKEKEMRESIQLSEISDMDLKLIKNYLELLKDINKINDLLDMKWGGKIYYGWDKRFNR